MAAAQGAVGADEHRGRQGRNAQLGGGLPLRVGGQPAGDTGLGGEPAGGVDHVAAVQAGGSAATAASAGDGPGQQEERHRQAGGVDRQQPGTDSHSAGGGRGGQRPGEHRPAGTRCSASSRRSRASIPGSAPATVKTPTATTSTPAAWTSPGRLPSRAAPSQKALAPSAVKVTPNPTTNSAAARIVRPVCEGASASPLT